MAPDQPISDQRNNSAALSGLQPQSPQPPWTPYLPLALSKGSGVWREVATAFIRQTPTTKILTKLHHNLGKNSQLVTRCLRTSPFRAGLPIGRSSIRNSRAPTNFSPHIHSFFIMCFLHSSLSLPFHPLDYLLDYHALPLQHTFPNLTPCFKFLPIQSILLPE